MSYQQSLKKLVAAASSQRCIFTTLTVVGVLYLIIYLLWASPASDADRRLGLLKKGKHAKVTLQASHDNLNNFQRHGLHIMPEGRGVWVPDRNIQIMTAIQDMNHEDQSELRVVLTAFLLHSSERRFVCCFRSSPDDEDYIQVPARLDYIDLRFIVNLQNAAFDCKLKKSAKNKDQTVNIVSFAPNSCEQNISSSSLRIVYPVKRSWEFAVCTKVAYGRLDPTQLIEWFEFMREVGASKIVTFWNNLHPSSKKVFEYYKNTGFLELIEYSPRSKEGFSDVMFTEKNSQTRQARHDKTLVVHDCQYRLGGYDFVMTIDFDELPVPARPYGSLNWLFQVLLQNHSDASSFRMDPLLLPPEWKNDDQELYHWQFNKGTFITPYCVKWVYIPSRTWSAATHETIPKEGYKSYVISRDLLHFLHFRSCKPEWREIPCNNLTQMVKNEDSLRRFTGAVIHHIYKLPLEVLIPDKKYVNFIRSDPRGPMENRRWEEDRTLGAIPSRH